MTQSPSVFQSRENRKEAGGVLIKIIMVLAGLAVVIPFLLEYGTSPPTQAGIDVSNIVNGQENFFATVGGGSYAANLSDLQQADMIEVQLGSGTKAGYEFSLSTGADGTTFTITARPQQYGQTETRSFFASQTGVVRYTDENRSAGPDDTPLQ
jgi:FlaG/FlaF family flagellin (archaellin)